MNRNNYFDFSNYNNYESYFQKYNQRFEKTYNEEKIYELLKNKEISITDAKNLLRLKEFR